MSITARLRKLSPGLTAQERAILVLGSLKDGTPEDPDWRRLMPPGQVYEFNRLIDLMNGANIQLAHYITVLDQQVDKLELRHAWLVSLVLWEEQVEEIGRAVRLALRAPVTRTEHEALVAANAAQWVPVQELASLLADDHDGWAQEDLETVEGWDQPVVSDAAWDRVCAEKENQLRRLVASGKLEGRGRGKGLRIQQGAFDSFFGRATATVPDDLLLYRVLPDDETVAVEAEKRAITRVFDALDARPLSVKDNPQRERALEAIGTALRESLAVQFADTWQAVVAVNAVLAEVSAEFGGTDPLKPSTREKVERSRTKLLHLARELTFLDVTVDLPEPDEELLQLVREMVERGGPY